MLVIKFLFKVSKFMYSGKSFINKEVHYISVCSFSLILFDITIFFNLYYLKNHFCKFLIMRNSDFIFMYSLWTS